MGICIMIQSMAQNLHRELKKVPWLPFLIRGPRAKAAGF